MRVSRSGLVVGILYVVLAVASITWSYNVSDPKAATFLMQLPIIPAGAVLYGFGLLPLFDTSPWIVYGICVPAIAIALYAVCWLLGRLSFRVKLVIGLVVLALLSFELLWPRSR